MSTNLVAALILATPAPTITIFLYCLVGTDTTGSGIGLGITTTGSGIIQNNVVRGLDVAAALMITAAAVQYGLFNNLYIGDVGLSGFVLPAIGTD